MEAVLVQLLPSAINSNVKPRMNDQTFSSNMVLGEHVLLFSRLSHLSLPLNSFLLSDVWSNIVCPLSNRTFCVTNTMLDENV